MFQNEDLSKEINFLNHIGGGSFGSVYICKNNNDKVVAIKCEKKENRTLYKEFKFYSKIFNIKNYLNKSEKEIIKDNDKNKNYIKIFEYLKQNNMLSIPEVISINLLKNDIIVPQPYSFYSCEDYDFLTMDLCGDNMEDIVKNYNLSERCKYYIAYKLLYLMASLHRCGIMHRDMKLANLVLNDKISNVEPNKLKLMLIDLGLSKEYYTYNNKSINFVKPEKYSGIMGTLRYISLNIHEYNSPTIIDDLISMCYMLVNIFTGKSLPWSGHLKDDEAFNRQKHKHSKCRCRFHENFNNGTTKINNTIAEVKFHYPLEKLCGNYTFLHKWIKYLYSLNLKQMPSYKQLLKILVDNTPKFDKLQFEFIKKNKK